MTHLPLPQLCDLTKRAHSATVTIQTTQHKFSSDSAPSGTDPIHDPVFGTTYVIDSQTPISSSFGLPFFKFKQGQSPHLKFINNTGFSTDLHFHGMNVPPDIDGASEVVVFGTDTKIGTVLNLNFPPITNNSCLLWVHSHNMFIESAFVFRGMYGILLIEDNISRCINKEFEYGDNHIVMVYEDMEFHSDGTMDISNLYKGGERANFGLINGISAINWYTDGPVPYVDSMYHKTTKNLIKLDILSGTWTFRTIYVGVCDKKNQIKNFTLIQTDQGFRNPIPLSMVQLAPANRISILIDLNHFKDGEAFVFMYNFDLSEIDTITLGPHNELLAPAPDLTKSNNPTPYPTPIPSSNTHLTYPMVPEIPYITQPVPGGNVVPPQISGSPYTIKKFLRIKWTGTKPTLSLKNTVRDIRTVVFGKDNYCKFKELFKEPNFEFSNPYKINYISLLNPKYFYNLPDINRAPIRNIMLFGDGNQNSVPPYGATEYINGADRVFADMWNEEELDLAFALEQYNMSPNNYKPTGLPTCLFKIESSKNDQYINYDMISNDTLTVQIFDSPINYLEKTIPLAEATIIFPETVKPLNIAQWTNIVNDKFVSTIINGGSLSDLLSYDWTFFPYKINYLTNRTQYIKTVLIKNTNKSPYWIRLIGKIPLMQYFGKAESAGSTIGPHGPFMFPDNYNNNITYMYPTWATSDPDTTIFSYDGRGVELIIKPHSIFNGFIDGFENDNLMNFSVQQQSSENWIYHNLGQIDQHPLHFHLVSGFADPLASSPEIVDTPHLYETHLYSQDTYAVGAQQSLSFYLRFVNYSSLDTTFEPPLKYLGFMIHCHYLTHVDMLMMIQYFVYRNKSEFF
jgi:FtsP/CotA-like multicopper oxidase with cupredoxin domain